MICYHSYARIFVMYIARYIPVKLIKLNVDEYHNGILCMGYHGIYDLVAPGTLWAMASTIRQYQKIIQGGL